MVTNGAVSVLVIYGKTNTLYILIDKNAHLHSDVSNLWKTNTLYLLIDKNAHLHSEWIPQPQQKSGAS